MCCTGVMTSSADSQLGAFHIRNSIEILKPGPKTQMNDIVKGEVDAPCRSSPYILHGELNAIYTWAKTGSPSIRRVGSRSSDDSSL